MVLLLAVRLLAVLVGWVAIQFTPGDAHFFESKMVYLARQVSAGKPLYPPWADFPYEPNFYTPAYFLITGLLGRLFALDDVGLRLVGRLLTWLSAGTTAFGAYAIVLRETGNRRAGGVAALAALSAAPLVAFGHMTRPDMMATTIALLGFWLYSDPSCRWRRVWSAPLFALATLTKQTALAAGMAAVLWDMLQGRWRQATAWAGAWLACVGVFIAATTLFWEPRCARDILGAGADPFSMGAGLQVLRLLVHSAPELGVVLLAFLTTCRESAGYRAIALFGVAAAGLGTLGCFKLGSDLNYFLDLAIAAAISTGILWSRMCPAEVGLAATVAGKWRRIIAASLCLLYVACLAGVSLVWTAGEASSRIQKWLRVRQHDPEARQFEQLVRFVRSPHRRVLTDNSYLALQSAHQPPFLDVFLFRVLVNDGRVVPKRLLAAIDEQAFDCVLSSADLRDDYLFSFPVAIRDAIQDRYTLAGYLGGMLVYVRKTNAKGSGLALPLENIGSEAASGVGRPVSSTRDRGSALPTTRSMFARRARE